MAAYGGEFRRSPPLAFVMTGRNTIRSVRYFTQYAHTFRQR